MPRRHAFDDDHDDFVEELTDAELAAALPPDDSTRTERFAAPRLRPTTVFDDDALLVIDKPAGLPIRSDPDNAGLLDLLGLAAPAAAVFPVDDGASGLVVVARRPELVAPLQQQIRNAAMQVVHHAIVRATLPDLHGAIELPLRIPRQPWAPVRVDTDRGQPAATTWRRVEAFAGHALLECLPVPILRHQVRAHLLAAGMPLAVDTAYGGGRELLLSTFNPMIRRSDPARPRAATRSTMPRAGRAYRG